MARRTTLPASPPVTPGHRVALGAIGCANIEQKSTAASDERDISNLNRRRGSNGITVREMVGSSRAQLAGQLFLYRSNWSFMVTAS
jgi:hypothetical protein